jgi:holliday junction DNA helicase RuvA
VRVSLKNRYFRICHNNVMIAYLNGIFAHKSPALLHIDVNGVGYEVHISLNTYSALQALQKGLVYTWLHVREDAHILYGFATPAEKELFLQLIGVSGIGANTARMMLSAMKPEELATAIAGSDVKLLETIKGIGRKTAERVVLELKDKMARQFVGGTGSMAAQAASPLKDAVDALTALGIGRPVAEQAVKKTAQAHPGLQTVEDIIKKALQLM